MYGSLEKINTPEKKIVTIEDPVEYQLRGVNQVHIRPQIGLTFANGLRSIVRQDPDVIMIGEIRDSEHSGRRHPISIDRASGVQHGSHQRCGGSNHPAAGNGNRKLSDLISSIGSARPTAGAGHLHPMQGELLDRSRSSVRNGDRRPGPAKAPSGGKGCDHCNETGYRGRTGIYELLVIDDEIRKMILAHASTQEIRERAIQLGMTTLRQDGWRKILEGITTVEEIIRVTHSLTGHRHMTTYFYQATDTTGDNYRRRCRSSRSAGCCPESPQPELLSH